jgi:hypothetical protein
MAPERTNGSLSYRGAIFGKHYRRADYLQRNDVSPIESPAQAWNVLTAGASTEKCNIASAAYNGWEPMGAAGDLSPRSRTSVLWQHDWPIKPDVVLEGGNLGIDPATRQADDIDDLALLTTFRRPEERTFTTTGDTSAATAQVARMGAQILADRPELWPETVRGLIAHSAEWTPAMRAHLPAIPTQNDKRALIRRYGYGVPDLTRAIRSLSNDVAMVIEGNVQPHAPEGSEIKTKDMMLHDVRALQNGVTRYAETDTFVGASHRCDTHLFSIVFCHRGGSPSHPRPSCRWKAPRGEGCAIIIFPRDFGGFSESAFSSRWLRRLIPCGLRKHAHSTLTHPICFRQRVRTHGGKFGCGLKRGLYSSTLPSGSTSSGGRTLSRSPNVRCFWPPPPLIGDVKASRSPWPRR